MKIARYLGLSLLVLALTIAGIKGARAGILGNDGSYPDNPGLGNSNSRVIMNALTGSTFSSSTLNNATLNSPTINNATIGSSTVNTSTLNSPTVNEQTITGGVQSSSTGYNALAIKSPVAMCTTSNTVGAVCAEPTQTFTTGFADTNYEVTCTCAAGGTNVPIVQALTKASNTLVVQIAALTAASASCAEVDCIAFHN
jgi:hypothetical protein